MINFPVLTDMPPPRDDIWTAADLDDLPRDNGERYEIIDGVLYVSKSPTNYHQWILFALVEHFGVPAKRSGLAHCFFAPTGVFMPGCDPVEPDFVLVLKANEGIIRNKHIYGVPDLVAEILSRSNTAYDLEVKFAAYAKAGVPEYVMIDPLKRILRHHRLIELDKYDEGKVYDEDDMVAFACLPNITFRVGDLFAGAPDITS
jgi:Uma2 family endonuclease